MSKRVITTAHLQTPSKAIRDELIAIFKEITDFSKAHEPGVHRYITAVPVDASNETCIYMIEEYADQAASDSHINQPVVKKLISRMGASPPALTGAPEIYNLAPVTDFKKPAEPTSDTVMILAHYEYKDGKATDALEGWKALSDYCKEKEQETRGYCVMEDTAKSTVRTVEVYTDAKFVSDVHVKSDAVRANQEQNGANRTGVHGAVKLRIVQGFLGKQ
ncbi:hypothetical protein EJ08DRAFT_692276 [Tothia fuscella]|uniref:ABM domain-containing protein n=1 Tax=Tothia fuscella TaxID=1048955 RepID=A0A9P4P025_9PEZI|nr:hypothetical protein EJ08DRAFT_692276 [Tothia fuscella]